MSFADGQRLLSILARKNEMEIEGGLEPAFEATAELAEKYLLGYLMLNSDAWWDAAKELNPGDFAGYVNCRIYLAIE